MDDLSVDLLDALDADSPENVTAVVIDELLTALGEHMTPGAALHLIRKAVANASKEMDDDTSDEEE